MSQQTIYIEQYTKDFLKKLGYDVNKNIHQQFLEKHRKALIETPGFKYHKRGPKKKSK
jgi:hypothetical protein